MKYSMLFYEAMAVLPPGFQDPQTDIVQHGETIIAIPGKGEPITYRSNAWGVWEPLKQLQILEIPTKSRFEAVFDSHIESIKRRPKLKLVANNVKN